MATLPGFPLVPELRSSSRLLLLHALYFLVFLFHPFFYQLFSLFSLTHLLAPFRLRQVPSEPLVLSTCKLIIYREEALSSRSWTSEAASRRRCLRTGFSVARGRRSDFTRGTRANRRDAPGDELTGTNARPELNGPLGEDGKDAAYQLDATTRYRYTLRPPRKLMPLRSQNNTDEPSCA